MTLTTESAAPAVDGPENLTRELLAVLARGKWTILSVFLLVTGIVTLGVLNTPPQFEAMASLMVRMGREYVYRSEVGRADQARTPSISEMVNSEVEILSSGDLAKQVVRELGVEKLYPEILEVEADGERAVDIAALRFRQSASIRPVLESSVIKVGFEHPVPETAAAAVNCLVERFEDKHLEVFSAEPSGLEEQLAERAGDLARAEEALADFKRRNGVLDLGEQRSLLLGQRVRAEEELHAFELQLAELRLTTDQQDEPVTLPELPAHLTPEMKGELLRQRHELERELRSLEPELPDNLIEAASLRLLDLELEESQLLREFSESNRRVTSVREEKQRVRAFLEESQRRAGIFDEVRRRERAARTQLLEAEIARISTELELLVQSEQRQLRLEARQRLAAVEVQRENTLRRITDLDAEVRTLDQHAKTLRQLERELAATESAVETYRQRVEEARIGEELDKAKRINVRVIERASAPAAPSGLPRSLKLAVGAFVGMIAGIGMAVLLDLFRSR